MDGERITAIALIVWVIILGLFLIIGTPILIYDSLYVKPTASQNANQYCEDRGFDFYESYSRIGLLSKEPIAIKCKYVEQYRDIDVNLNQPIN